MKTYLVWLLICTSVNATDCKPLTLTSVSGAHSASQAEQQAIELATDCNKHDDDDDAPVCEKGFIKLDRVELAP